MVEEHGDGNSSGGGGGGGYREGKATTFDSYTASPLVAPDGFSSNSFKPIPITVEQAVQQELRRTCKRIKWIKFNIFSSITSAGGGGSGGATPFSTRAPGVAGGSGGGSTGYLSPGSLPVSGGAGNTPPVSPPQGNAGGNSQGRYAFLEAVVLQQQVVVQIFGMYFCISQLVVREQLQ